MMMKKILYITLFSFVLLLTSAQSSSAAISPVCEGGYCSPDRSACVQGYNFRSDDTCSVGGACCPSRVFTGTPGQAVTGAQLDALNPLIQESDVADELQTPGGIVNRFLRDYAFPLAGLILFVMLVWGGFEMMTGAATKKSIDAGKQRVTAALIGFVLLFVAYWITQIIELVFGIKVL